MNKGDTEPPRKAPSGQLKQKRGRKDGWSLVGRDVGYTRWIGYLLIPYGNRDGRVLLGPEQALGSEGVARPVGDPLLDAELKPAKVGASPTPTRGDIAREEPARKPARVGASPTHY